MAAVLERGNPDWGEERLYQEARRVTVAQYQHIVYKEWLPVILGNDSLPTAASLIVKFVYREQLHAAIWYFPTVIRTLF